MNKQIVKVFIILTNKNCKKYLYNMSALLIIFFFINSMISCMPVGMFSEQKTFTGSESMSIENPRDDILNVVAAVGRSMNYNISGLDRESGLISLSSSSPMTSMMLIGKMNRADLRIFVAEDGTKLNIQYSVLGNFGAGDYEAATQLVEDFKSEMNKALQQ